MTRRFPEPTNGPLKKRNPVVTLSIVPPPLLIVMTRLNWAGDIRIRAVVAARVHQRPAIQNDIRAGTEARVDVVRGHRAEGDFTAGDDRGAGVGGWRHSRGSAFRPPSW